MSLQGDQERRSVDVLVSIQGEQEKSSVSLQGEQEKSSVDVFVSSIVPPRYQLQTMDEIRTIPDAEAAMLLKILALGRRPVDLLSSPNQCDVAADCPTWHVDAASRARGAAASVCSS